MTEVSKHNVDTGEVHRKLMARSRPVWRLLGAGGALSVVSALVLAAQMFAIAYGINALFIDGAAIADLSWPIVVLVALTVLRAAVQGLRRRVDEEAGLVMGDRIFADLVDRTVAGDAPHGADTAWVTSAGTRGVERIENFFTHFVPRAIDMVAVPLTLLAVVAVADPFSAVVLVVTAPLIPIFMVLIGNKAKQKTTRQWRAFERLGGHFRDSLRGLSTLQVFGRLDGHPDRLARSAESLRDKTMSVLKVAFLSSMVLEVAASLSTAVVAVEIGVRLVEGWMAFLPGLFVLLLVPEFYMAFRRFGSEHHTGMEVAAAAAPILEVLDGGRTDDGHGESTDDQSSVIFDAPPSIELNELTLGYGDDDREVVSGLSMQCRPGELTVVRGRSGCGKSTVAAALVGTLPVRSGEILWNRRRQRPATGQIAFAPQRPYLFATSIAENLRIAQPDATDRQLWEVLQQVGLDELVAELPRGLETDVAEAGESLSGGERHRLAVARALLRPAPVVVLDEPSAQLDEETEARLIEALRRRRNQSTIVVFTHRRAFFDAADHLVELDSTVKSSAQEVA